MSTTRIPVAIVPSIRPCAGSPQQVGREFGRVVAGGAKIRISGRARNQPEALFSRGLRPKHKLVLFETEFYVTNVRQIPELRFFVAYVVQTAGRGRRPVIYPRIFYKDLSLVWRSASHFTYVNGDFWVGKGAVRLDEEDGLETLESVESTTDLPLEMQTALERLASRTRRASSGAGILALVLKQAPEHRVEPWPDFNTPRERAASNPDNLIHGGQPVARFRRPGDPTSLEIVSGYEPDFIDGVIERTTSRSRLYGGRLVRFRILSRNRLIQYFFLAGARHAWIIPPQATTTELSSYGVRTIDVVADDDLFIPGYEYHHYEETRGGRELYSQIPAGYAGAVCPVDEAKADATPWLDRIPLIQQFRRALLP